MNEEAHFLRDFACELKNKALEIKVSLKATPDDIFMSGQLFGLVHSISLLQQQAVAFGLAPDVLNLGDFDAEKDLLISRASEKSSKAGNDKSIEAIIASPPGREELVVQLFLKEGGQWGEIYRDSKSYKLELYAKPDGQPWQLDLEEVQKVLGLSGQELNHRLE